MAEPAISKRPAWPGWFGAALALVSTGWAEFRFDHPVVKDVPAAFARIAANGNRLGGWATEAIPYPAYSFNLDHDFGDNHFQGIQRLRAGPYFVVSGGNIGRLGDLTRQGLPQPAAMAGLPAPQGDLFVLRLRSRPGTGELGSNLDRVTLAPNPEDRVVAAVPIALALPSGTRLWHPGGLGTLGDILVVPVENYNPVHGEVCSQILFYDMSNPERPVLFPHRIDRTVAPAKDKAGAATMVRLPTGHFLVASRTSTHLSFYHSRTTNFADGFEAAPAVVFDEKEAVAAEGLAPTKFHGSSFQGVMQADGRLFFVCFSRVVAAGEGSSRREEGRHVATLYRADFPAADFRRRPQVTKVAERTFGAGLLGYTGWGSFGAAAGVFVTDDGRLALYAAPRWTVAKVGPLRPDDVTAQRYVRRGEPVFIPVAEFWPR